MPDSGPSDSLAQPARSASDLEGPGLPAAGVAGDPAEACVVHITDLHVGRQFNDTVWESFVDTCRDLSPDLILVTGDLVDSPWHCSLRRARCKLRKARARVDESRKSAGGDSRACRLLVVPGNHDTRIRGVAPLRRLFTPLVACLSVALIAAVLAHPFAGFLREILWGALAAIALVWLVYWIPFGRFYFYFRAEAVTARTLVPCGAVTVEVFPFDSASFPIVLAGGEVQLDQFVRSQRPPAEQAATDGLVYRIAALHHHPAPIPYDHALEETMILRNAGALLLELAKLDVRLIVHGHKHHWHFGRFPVETGRGSLRQMAVLGGSTLTRGLGRADGDTFGFNVIRIDPSGMARITRYTSNGGPFDVQQEFNVDDAASNSQWLQQAASKEHGVRCRLVTDGVEINLDGDAESRWEVRGFRVVEPNRWCDRMPGNRWVKVSHGHIERVEARPLSANGPRLLRFEAEEKRLREQCGAVVFGRSVDDSELPFDFFRRWHGVNSYAMTAGQFRRMYPPGPPYEFISSTTPQFPCDEFRLSVLFPASFEIDGHPDIEVLNNRGQRMPRLEREWRPALYYSPLDSAISLDIAWPPPNVQIVVRWRLVDRDPPEGLSVRPLEGEAKELAAWLLSVRRNETINVDVDTWRQLCDIVAVVENTVRKGFDLPQREEEPLEVSIAAYDPEEEKLRFVLGNFPPDSPAWKFRLAYGDGIAGRAFKANKARWFVKARAERTGTPYYYFPAPGFVGGEGIKDEVVLAVPLTHQDDPRELYGVLSVSSKRPASRLANQDGSNRTPAILEALNKFCFVRAVEHKQRSLTRASAGE